MAESERLWEEHLKRTKARKGIYDDWDGLYAYLEAVAREALEEKTKAERERAKARS